MARRRIPADGVGFRDEAAASSEVFEDRVGYAHDVQSMP